MDSTAILVCLESAVPHRSILRTDLMVYSERKIVQRAQNLRPSGPLVIRPSQYP